MRSSPLSSEGCNSYGEAHMVWDGKHLPTSLIMDEYDQGNKLPL